jgi:hypothetical protein
MGVCLEAGVDYMRFRNWKFGSVKTLSDDEEDYGFPYTLNF